MLEGKLTRIVCKICSKEKYKYQNPVIEVGLQLLLITIKEIGPTIVEIQLFTSEKVSGETIGQHL